jgi:hypothetical protein
MIDDIDLLDVVRAMVRDPRLADRAKIRLSGATAPVRDDRHDRDRQSEQCEYKPGHGC